MVERTRFCVKTIIKFQKSPSIVRLSQCGLSEDGVVPHLIFCLFDIGHDRLLHIPPRALPGQEVVTIKTEGCVLTLGPQRCYKYDF